MNGSIAPFPVSPPPPPTHALPEHAKRLATLLLSHGLMVDVPTQRLAEELRVPIADLGASVSALKTWGANHGLSKDDIIVKTRRRSGSGGGHVRMMRLGNPFIDKLTESRAFAFSANFARRLWYILVRGRSAMAIRPSPEELARQQTFLDDTYGTGASMRPYIGLLVTSLDELRARMRTRSQQLAGHAISDPPSPEDVAYLERMAAADRADMTALTGYLKGLSAAEVMLGNGSSHDPADTITYEQFVHKSYTELRSKADQIARSVVTS